VLIRKLSLLSPPSNLEYGDFSIPVARLRLQGNPVQLVKEFIEKVNFYIFIFFKLNIYLIYKIIIYILIIKKKKKKQNKKKIKKINFF